MASHSERPTSKKLTDSKLAREIAAASKTYGDALVSNEPKLPELIGLYPMVSRMRAVGMPRTVECVDLVTQAIMSSCSIRTRKSRVENGSARVLLMRPQVMTVGAVRPVRLSRSASLWESAMRSASAACVSWSSLPDGGCSARYRRAASPRPCLSRTGGRRCASRPRTSPGRPDASRPIRRPDRGRRSRPPPRPCARRTSCRAASRSCRAAPT